MFLSLANADSVIATTTVGTGPYGAAIFVSSSIKTRKLIVSSALRELDLLGTIGFVETQKEIENITDFWSFSFTNVRTCVEPGVIQCHHTHLFEDYI